MRLILVWLLTAGVLFAGSMYSPWVKVGSFWSSLGVAFVLGLINLTIRPILLLLTLPLNFLTFGLLTFVINALMILLADWLIPSFAVGGFWPALVLSLIIAALTALVAKE